MENDDIPPILTPYTDCGPTRTVSLRLIYIGRIKFRYFMNRVCLTYTLDEVTIFTNTLQYFKIIVKWNIWSSVYSLGIFATVLYIPTESNVVFVSVTFTFVTLYLTLVKAV